MDFDRLLSIAREDGPTCREDADAEKTVSDIYKLGDTQKALNVLYLASNYLEDGQRLPRIIELYLSVALGKIATGNDPAQSLHLKAKRKPKTSDSDLMNIYCCVEKYMHEGEGVSERAAVQRYASETNLKYSTADKRYQQAKVHVGSKLDVFRQVMLWAEQRIERPDPLGLSQQLMKSSPTPLTDDFMNGINDLLGVPKKA